MDYNFIWRKNEKRKSKYFKSKSRLFEGILMAEILVEMKSVKTLIIFVKYNIYSIINSTISFVSFNYPKVLFIITTEWRRMTL